MLEKPNLNTIEVLIFKAFIDSDINHFSVNNVLREYNNIKKQSKNLRSSIIYINMVNMIKNIKNLLISLILKD